MKNPCKGCGKRTITCHGFCEDYQQWKKEHDEKAAKERQARQFNGLSRQQTIKWWKNMKRGV